MAVNVNVNVTNPIRAKFDDMPAKDQRIIVQTLDDLRSTCLAAQAGYDEAANEVTNDPRLRDFLRSMAIERRTFAEELGHLLDAFGEKPGAGWSAKANLHRVWIDLRAFLERHDPVALISECERGENAALERYEKALKLPLSMEVEEVLIDHASSIREARSGLDRMRHPW